MIAFEKLQELIKTQNMHHLFDFFDEKGNYKLEPYFEKAYADSYSKSISKRFY